MVSASDILQARILIVDDQDANILLLERMLKGAGYTSVSSTKSPRDVCDLHRKHSYSLILLDLQMPEMDGFQVMEALKEVDTTGYLPILVQTGLPMHRLKALQMGAKDFVSKPIDLAEVLLRVHNMLEVRLLHAEATLRSKQAETREQELRASELKYRRLFETAQEGILILDSEDNSITDANPFVEGLLGFSRQEMLGKSVSQLPAFKGLKTYGVEVEELPQDECSHFEELPLIKSDGQTIYVDLVSNTFPVGEKNIIHWMLRDITERKAAQNEVNCLNSSLERRVADRTAQLEDANKELQAFSYSVSHDLRAPLRHVLGFVQLLRKNAESSLSEENLVLLTTISEAANRMGTLIDDLLEFSRFGQAALQRSDVNLDELVQETLKDFKEETTGRKIEWNIHPLPCLHADQALLRMVLSNLISNALKFTGTRSEAIIEIGCAPSGDAETVIFIRDNGAGFDPKYTEKLFGVFQRLHSRDEFEGTGIGLANVQRIIHRHGGRVWAEGIVDKGATFYFSIPKESNH